jgi:Mrp family chromosome partitioning ATPase
MDFIQSAIEKARRERLQRAGAPDALVTEEATHGAAAEAAATQAAPQSAVHLADRPMERAATARPVPGARAPEADPVAARAALWSGLPEIRVQRDELERNRVLAYAGGSEAATFDIMRTKLLQQMRSNNWRRVAITSPTAACGKTMLALNLAFSLARQPDIFSMLLEFDLRRPTISKVLGLKESRQFSKVLERQAAPDDHLLRHGRNLLIAPSAHRSNNPAELLQSVETGRIMDAVEARFAPDVMLFDMPPMLVSDDTLAFIDQIDCVLLVAAAGSSTIAEINRCADDLAARCNFLGVVLNKCRYLDGDDAYGYGYGYTSAGPQG